MDITTLPVSQVVTTYHRQEKLAEARKNAEAKMIKTAVAERISISTEARELAGSRLPELSGQSTPVAQTLRGMRRTSSVAREYSKNQPNAEQAAQPSQEIENISPVQKMETMRGRPEVLPRDGPHPQPTLVQVSSQSSGYSFPIPRELQIYIANLPKEKSPIQRSDRYREDV